MLILSGDQLYQMDFAAMIDNHATQGADITIATIPVGDREATEFGILKTDAQNNITSFIEKPAKELLPEWISDTGTAMQEQGRNYLASMGIYIFNRKTLFDFLLVDKKEATDFGKEIIPTSINTHKVISYQYDGYWTDIGNITANSAITTPPPSIPNCSAIAENGKSVNCTGMYSPFVNDHRAVDRNYGHGLG